MASVANPAASAESTGSPTPTGTETQGVPAATPAAQGSSAGPLPASGELNWSTAPAQFRQQYETLKSQAEPYLKLGSKPEEIQSHMAIAQKFSTGVVEIGTALGYDEEEVRQSLASDPQGTYDFLRQKQAEAEKNGTAQQPDIKKLLQKELDARLKPITEREEKRMNDEAVYRYDQAFDSQFNALFKDELKDFPADEKATLYDVASFMFQGDKEAMARLKFEGKTSDVSKYVDQARSWLDKYFLARTQRDQKRAGIAGQSNPAQGNGDTKINIEDLIQGNFPKTGPLSKYT
jgi:hypothetical protein